MPVNLKSTRLTYFPVPKVACTSVKTAALNFNEPEYLDATGWHVTPEGARKNAHDRYYSVPFQPRYRLQYGLRRWFCVVRDPLKRFMSAYSNRIGYLDKVGEIPEAALTAKGLARHPDPNEFAIRLDDYMSLNADIDHHLKPMTAYLSDQPRRFDRIFAMSELSQIAPYCAEAGAPLELPHMGAKGEKLSASVLSSEARDKLKAFYADDYRIWGQYIDG